MTMDYIPIPSIKAGLRPYMSPIRVIIIDPRTIPAKKKDPKRPIVISLSQSRSNWTIKLFSVS